MIRVGELTGEARKRYNATLIPYAQWSEHPDMPAECLEVAKGEKAYAGLEGIGRNEQNGWYLLLYVPPEPSEEGFKPIGNSGLSGVAQLVSYSPDEGTVTLLYIERGSVDFGSA